MHTLSYSYAWSPFRRWHLSLGHIMTIRCAWTLRGWCNNWNVPYRGILFRCEELDVCIQDRRQRCSTGCRWLDDTDCQALGNMKVIGNWSSQLKIPCLAMHSEFTPHCSQVVWRRVSKSANSCGQINYAGFFRSIQHSMLVMSIICVSVLRQQGSSWHFGIKLQWLATR